MSNYNKRLKQDSKLSKEIEEITSQNPLTIEDIVLDEELTLYEPLKGKSRYNFNNLKDPPIIRDFFDSLYPFCPLHLLASKDKFIVYDKDLKTNSVLITKPVWTDPNPAWIPCKYLQK